MSAVDPSRPWIDLQVNGSFGLDFNSDDWEFASADRVASRWLDEGCRGILATVITDEVSAMIRRVKRIRKWCSESENARQCIIGIHIEGPFISSLPGYAGAHPAEWTCDSNRTVIDQMMEASEGLIRLWTLAPERDPGGIATRHLVDSGVVVSAGHSEARLADLDIAIEQGLSMFTHLGNGCPGDIKRHDNTITRVLSRADALKISFIADGHHIPWFALRQYLSLVPESNIVIVSDAMQAAGVGPGTYRLADQTVIVDPDQSAWSEDRSHFAGSATTLPMMMRLLIEQQIGTPMQVERWCYRNPGALLSRSSGRIEDAPAG